MNILSFRTERSGVKNLGDIYVYAIEILRFALDDNTWNTSSCIRAREAG